MLAQGLSFITFNASSQDIFLSTLRFYQTLGFKVAQDKGDEQRVAWLKLSSTSDQDATIKLVLSDAALPQKQPAADIDWSFEQVAYSFAIQDVEVKMCVSIV